MKKYSVILAGVAVIAVAAVLMFVLLSFKKDPPKKEKMVVAKPYESVVAVKDNYNANINVYGRMVTSQPVILTAEVSGELLKGDVKFLPGQRFNKGDLLAKIDDRQMQLEISSTKSDFLNAFALVLPNIKVEFPEDYDKWMNYFRSVTFEDKLPKMPEAENEQIKLYLTRNNVYKLYFSIKNKEITHSKYFFRAPFNGSILSVGYRPGSSIRSGTQLGQIINLDQMEIEAPVSVSDLNWLDINNKAVITSKTLPGEWKGSIKRMGSNIEGASQTVNIYIDVNSLHEYKFNGLFFNVTLTGKTVANSVVVPRSAIYNDHSVYIIKNGKIALSDVKIDRRETSLVYITDGIENGDTVITETLQGVVPGMPARGIVDEIKGGNS